MEILYNNFKGGYNDTLSPLEIGKDEVLVAKNADITSVVKGFKTRKGNSIEEGPFAGMTFSGEFMSGGEIVRYVVANKNLYRIVDGSLVLRKSGLATDDINEFYHNNRFYFTDGSEYYVWGDYDYTSESGTVNITTGDIVQNLGSSGGGTEEHFYQAKSDLGSIDLGTTDYSNATNWDDVTEIAGKNSNVVRAVEDYNGSVKEIATLEVFDGCEEDGTVSVYLDGVEFTVDVLNGDSVNTVISKIVATSFTGWTAVADGNIVTFTAETAELKDNGFFDPKDTGIIAVMVTETNGQPDDNDLAPIKKCTKFLVHPTSMRVFAAGNPDDPDVLYYSDIGQPFYFPSINRLVPIQGEGSILALKNLHDAVLLSYKTGWYKWTGIEVGEDAQWKPISLPNGAVNNDCVALVPYSFMFLAEDGLYRVSASIISEDTTMVSSKNVVKNVAKDKVTTTLKAITDIAEVEGVYHDNKYLLAFCDDGTGINNKVLEYSLDNNGFTLITGWQVDRWMKSKDGNLYFQSGDYILKAFENYYDIDITDGSQKAIDFDVSLKYINMGKPLLDKLVRFITIIADKQTTDVSNVNVEIQAGDNQDAIESIDLSKALVSSFNQVIERRANVVMCADTFKIRVYSSSISNPIAIIGFALNYEETRATRPNAVDITDLLT